MKKRGIQALLLFCCLLSSAVVPVCAEEIRTDTDEYAPVRYGFAVLGGMAYNPQNIGLAIVQGQILFDYEQIFWHPAPDDMRLKFEVNAGLTLDGRQRGLLSVNMLALRYLDRYSLADWTPYVEAGIGVIYTDFRVDGQGLNLNFNPQAGAGFEHALPDGSAITTALRFHHISNGNFDKDNRGINSVLLMIGYLF